MPQNFIMEQSWTSLSSKQIHDRVFEANQQNINYQSEYILGVPASDLDECVFYKNEPFLKKAPFLYTMVQNPNHIGCHTLGKSERFFNGTQAIEREVIEICSSSIMGAEPNSCDGYVSAGGTEANIQAMWIYRNYFMYELGVNQSNIAILCSEDTHYSADKGANLLSLNLIKIGVDDERVVLKKELDLALNMAVNRGITHFVVLANMMTTMFGSVDDVDVYVKALRAQNCTFKLHVDGAYGGFYHPFVDQGSCLNFSNAYVDSITLDAHKMVQAPYGTGIFLIRKGWMQYATTNQASYVEGEDSTLAGSRSGANAVAIWMILKTYGYEGWKDRISMLQERTNSLCLSLTEMGIAFYRNPKSNIVAINASHISATSSSKFGLVPDNHHHPKWYKVVIMTHVTQNKIDKFLAEIKI